MNKIVVFALICVVFVFFLFFKAFSLGFIGDDFSFLKTTNIETIYGFLNFFNPIRSVFYRPLGTEVFYFAIQKLPYSIVIGHAIVFITYLIGLLFLYKNIVCIFKSRALAAIVVFLYSIHLTHVYQLYWLATYQEVLLFTAISVSLYLYLKNKAVASFIYFIIALLSKETAILFPVFLFIYEFLTTKNYKKIVPLFIGAIIAGIVFVLSARYVSQNANYAFLASPKLIVNNILWYGLWSLGFSSIFPNYFPSIFGLPIASFSKFYTDPYFVLYSIFLLLFLLFMIISVILVFVRNKKYRKHMAIFTSVFLFLFLVSISLFLPIVHRWMVRLTVPLLFVIIPFSWVINKVWIDKPIRFLAVVLILFYSMFNYFGIRFEENASTYFLQNQIVNNAKEIFRNESANIIYIANNPKESSDSWISSKNIAVALWGNDFVKYYFPNKKITLYYQHETSKKPEGSITIEAIEFFK